MTARRRRRRRRGGGGRRRRIGETLTTVTACFSLYYCLSVLLSAGIAAEASTNYSYTKTSNRRRAIVGGTEVPLGRYPFFGFWNVAGCGATLIHEDLFLTAAHCVLSFQQNQQQHQQSSSSSSKNPNLGHVRLHTVGAPARFDVVQILVHPKFNQQRAEPKWDFAILKVDKPIPPTLATPVPLNSDPSFLTTQEESSYLTTLGFGFLKEGAGSYSTTLQEVTVEYIPNYPICSRSLGNDISDAEICAGNYYKGGKDACDGDSGGPLLWNFGHNLYNTKPKQSNSIVLVGVVSWGRGCARVGVPGVYARTSSALDWIHSVMCFHSDSTPTIDKEICQSIEQPPITIHVKIHYNETMEEGDNMISWGLYHVDSGTTIYQTQLDQDKDGERRHLSTSSSSTSSSRELLSDYEEDLYVFKTAGDGTTWQFTLLSAGKYAFQIRDHSKNCVNSVKVTQEGPQPKILIDEQGPLSSFYLAYFTVAEENTIFAIKEDDKSNLADENLVHTTTLEVLTVEILYDQSATDNSWMLTRQLSSRADAGQDGSYRQVLFYSPRFSATGSQLVSMSFNVTTPSKDIYAFTLFDAGGNGLCCSKGMGWVAIWLGDKVIFSSDGKFHSKLSTTIDLSAR